MAAITAEQAYELCGPGPFLGTVKQSGAKFGFIECDVTFRHFSRDVFVPSRLLPPTVPNGTTVSFTLGLSDKGEPQGEGVELLSAAPAVPIPQQRFVVKQQPQPRAVPLQRPTAQITQVTTTQPTKPTFSTEQPKRTYAPQQQQQQQMMFRPRPQPAVALTQQTMMQPMMMMQPMNPQMMMAQQQQMQSAMANMQAQAQGLARAAPERLTVYKGTVKNISERGFCFVSCPAVTAKFRRDVYFDAEEIERGGLLEGKEVDFVLRRNERNQPTGKVVPANGIFCGVLKTYSEEKGFGFIACDEAKRLFDMDVWVHGKEVTACGADVGTEMQFYIQLNSKNQPQACAVRRHQGFVKKRGRFTFIESAEVKQLYGKDAFVRDGDAYLEGLRVSFLLTFSDQMDPQAEDVEITGDVQACEYEQPEEDDGAYADTNDAAGIDNVDNSAPPMPVAKTMYEGVMKSCGPKYGFVESDQVKRIYGKDVFVNSFIQQQENLSVGDPVVFTLQLNDQGNPQAIQVKKRALSGSDDPFAKKQRVA
eukprot:GEMP01034015.1.p1 GENE.GEMP01034015.1~~GEMP01034015.1.p1  ORF type:complete len:533 (-),score=137.14 GEMP01034015.1:436-2034(-)